MPPDPPEASSGAEEQAHGGQTPCEGMGVPRPAEHAWPGPPQAEGTRQVTQGWAVAGIFRWRERQGKAPGAIIRLVPAVGPRGRGVRGTEWGSWVPAPEAQAAFSSLFYPLLSHQSGP